MVDTTTPISFIPIEVTPKSDRIFKIKSIIKSGNMQYPRIDTL